MKRGGADDIFQASKKGDLARVKELVESGADVNVKNRHGETALMIATFKKHLDIVKYLVEKGADMNVQDINKETALMFAIGKNRIDIVKYLVEKGADVNVKNNGGYTACDGTANPELKVLLCPKPAKPSPTEERNIPAGSETEITYEEIKNGDVLVDFNKEYVHKRYYDPETVSKLKSNPHTREPIGKKTVYTAKIVAGGKRRKTIRRNLYRKRTKKMKKTRKQ